MIQADQLGPTDPEVQRRLEVLDFLESQVCPIHPEFPHHPECQCLPVVQQDLLVLYFH